MWGKESEFHQKLKNFHPWKCIILGYIIFISFSVNVNFLRFMKSSPCFLESAQAGVAFGLLMVFLLSFNFLLNGASTFAPYGILHKTIPWAVLSSYFSCIVDEKVSTFHLLGDWGMILYSSHEDIFFIILLSSWRFGRNQNITC